MLRLIVFNLDAATVIARAKGAFAAEGLELEVMVTPSSTAQMRGLGAGTWDIASTAFDNVLAWSGREGAEIVAVAQVADRVVLPVLARPEIRDWSDLRGRPLAVDAVDTAYALVLRRILLAHGLDVERADYELVPVGSTQHRLESMAKGETFAAILNPPWDGRAASAGMVRLGDHREVLPEYPGGVFAVTRAWMKERRSDLVRFLRVWAASLRRANASANRDETLQCIASEQGIGPEGAARQLARLPASGELKLAGLGAVLDLRVRFGLTPPMGRDLSHYVDPGPYREARGSS